MILSSRSLKWVWSTWLLIAVLGGLYSLIFSKVIETNILSLMPVEAGQTLVKNATERLAHKFENKVHLLVGSPSTALSVDAQQLVIERLQNSPLFNEVSVLDIQKSSRAPDVYLESAGFFIKRADRAIVDDAEKLIAQAFENIQFSSRQSQLGFAEDPFDFFDRWWESLTPNIPVALEGKSILIPFADEFYAFVSVELASSAYQLSYQQNVVEYFDAIINELPSGIKVYRSGLVFHAEHGSRQAITEMNVIGLGSLIFVILILVLSFRSGAALKFALLAVTCGIVSAFFLSILIFERVHIITLAFGASLIGIAIDYALHFLVAVREKQTANKSLIMALGFALMTSVCAFALQGLTPLPGLKQIALFSVTGLISAWLTVVAFGSYAETRQLVVSKPLHRVLSRFFDFVSSNRAIKVLYVIPFIIIAVTLLKPPQLLNDLRLLNSSPMSLIEQERQFSAILRAPETSRFFLVQADSPEELLIKNETLSKGLDVLQDSAVLLQYDALSRYIPSAKSQQSNAQSWAKAYNLEHSDSAIFKLAVKLGASSSDFKSIKDTPGKPVQLIQALDDLAFRERFDHLLLSANDQQGYASIVTVSGIDLARIDELEAYANDLNGIYWVDSVAAINHILQKQNISVLQWLLGAYLLIGLLLAPRYGAKTLYLIAPSLLASGLTISIQSLLGIPLNLFSSVALLLILGIGLDMTIMLSEYRHDRYAWLASSLSTLTSLVAFGLLALSQTPVLHHFGFTVLIGLPLVWLITPGVIKCSQKERV